MPPLIPKSPAIAALLAFKHRRDSLLRALLQCRVPIHPQGRLTQQAHTQTSHLKTLLPESKGQGSLNALQQGYKGIDEDSIGSHSLARPDYGQNMRFHNKRYNKQEFRCEICNKVFGHMSNLDVHLQTHFHDTPFKCRRGPENYTPLASLQKHVHTGKI